MTVEELEKELESNMQIDELEPRIVPSGSWADD